MTASPEEISVFRIRSPSRVSTISLPSRTTVYSSNSGVCPGSFHPGGLFILAMLTELDPVFTFPMYSSIIFGLFPEASTTAGFSIFFM
jgi:hypothetical protein